MITLKELLPILEGEFVKINYHGWTTSGYVSKNHPFPSQFDKLLNEEVKQYSSQIMKDDYEGVYLEIELC